MRYLSAAEVIRMNVYIILELSPKEMVGVKEPEALEALIALPKQEVFGKELYPTIFEKAAILLINLIKRHPFFNGNKRTAVIACVSFLKYNNFNLEMSQDSLVQLAVNIATNNTEFEILKKEVTMTLSVSSHLIIK